MNVKTAVLAGVAFSIPIALVVAMNIEQLAGGQHAGPPRGKLLYFYSTT
jgi:hypothetical protein